MTTTVLTFVVGGGNEDNEKEQCDNNNHVLDNKSNSSDDESLHALAKEVRRKHTPSVVHVDNDNIFDDFWERNDKDYFPIINRNIKMIGRM
jgi:hypothetical protein